MLGTPRWGALDDYEESTNASQLPSEWDRQPMDRIGVATDSVKLHSMKLKPLTRGEVCSIIPPLKASALRIPDGMATEGTLCISYLGRNPESPRSCSQPTF
jgi:hypothetical protein